MNPARFLPLTLAALLAAGSAVAQDEPASVVETTSESLIGPAVQPLGPGRVVIVWEDREPAPPERLTLQSAGRADVSAPVADASGIRSAEFEGLEPGVEYRYAVAG